MNQSFKPYQLEKYLTTSEIRETKENRDLLNIGENDIDIKNQATMNRYNLCKIGIAGKIGHHFVTHFILKRIYNLD